MADLETSLRTDASSNSPHQPIRLPVERTLYTPPTNEVIVVSRSLLSYTLLTLIFFVGAYTLGWFMSTSNGKTNNAAQGSAAAATSAVQPDSKANRATAPLQEPFSRDPGQRFTTQGHEVDLAVLLSQINPPEGYTLPVKFGKIGPQLIASGAIDRDRFVKLYEQAGQPLTAAQLAILTQGSDSPFVVDEKNTYFLLNFLWALGLNNQNRILTEGPMMRDGPDKIGNFASTGGWTLGTKSAVELYSHTPLITLTPEQQTRLETVAAAVYRPCCMNPTLFPDCNHGMAMLAMLELMASQNATANEMFTAAKQVNAFWFPQQALEMATYFKAERGSDFAGVDAQQVVGIDLSSSTGSRNVHQWLASNDLIELNGGAGSRCGV